MVEINKLNQIILDRLPHWAMLIEVDTKKIIAANKVATDRGARIHGQCWNDFLHQRFISEMHRKRIAERPGQIEHLDIRCQFCLADQAMQSGQSQQAEVEIDGNIWDTWWVPVEKNIYLHYAIDITTTKKNQVALHESEERYFKVVNTMRDGLAIANQEGVIQFVNPAFCHLYQYTRNELIGSLAARLIHPDYHHVYEQFFQKLDQTGLFSGETVDIRKNGTLFTTHVKGARIHFNGQQCYLAAIRDITEQKKAERILKEQEVFYRSLFENNTSVILLIEPDTGRIFDANPSACKYYGFSREKLKKSSITDINTLSKTDVFLEMERAKAEERNYFNFAHRLSDGTIREVEVFSGPITVGGKALLCSIVHDISERKFAEMERESLIGNLKKALSEVKTLSGLLPICASCKKVRDDKGYWNEIEAYIGSHSKAEFSHSICPKCAKKLYPGYYDSDD